MEAAEALYRRLDVQTDPDGARRETFASLAGTVSPWGPDLQHAGPVTGLLARAMDRLGPREGTRISQVRVDLLGPVPVSNVEVRAWVARPGRRIELLEAEMCAAGPDGAMRPVARSSGWRLKTSDTRAAEHLADAPLEGTDRLEREEAFPLPEVWRSGFVATLDWRGASALGQREGPSHSWMRLRGALVEGEALTDFDRVMTIVDVANGVGARLDPAEWLFLNTEITVHLFRPPAGEWVGLRAESSVGPDGVATSAGVIFGLEGPVGRVAQNLLVERRR